MNNSAENKMRKIYFITIPLLAMLSSRSTAQQVDSVRFIESVSVMARPSKDSITLRWAPLEFKVWQLGNSNGYIVERYVMVRDGKVLRQPEKTTLTERPIRPLAENAWEPLVRKDKYAAIAAQALFGASFELDMKQTDVFSIVNKVRENEQRFAFALFSADMSPSVAKASGLYFTDRKTKKGEKYLYRIIIDPHVDSLRGSVFVGSDEPYSLPKPANVSASVKEYNVSLRWDRNPTNKYTAFVIERSADGRNFAPISETPLVTVSPDQNSESRYEYAADSIPDISKTWYYRVKGVTPFGEYGTVSDVVEVKGTVSVRDVPYISSAENINNKSIRVSWQLPEGTNIALKGFVVEKASKPQGTYNAAHANLLPPSQRTFLDEKPNQTNYYRVTAEGLDGERYRSPVFYAQLVDSIPPAPPTGLKGTIKDNGELLFTWEPNKEEDIYGYRIYRSFYSTHEFSQLTSEPMAKNAFRDSINLNTLNKFVYYKVMAIDQNQNHSKLSAALKIVLPDKVRPQPPVFLPPSNSDQGTSLKWIRSASEDVVRYDVYRKDQGQEEWKKLNSVTSSSDTVYTFNDLTAISGKPVAYTIVAVDGSGLESEPSMPVAGVKIDAKVRPPVQWKQHKLVNEKSQLVLNWDYQESQVKSFQIYRAVDQGDIVLHQSVTAEKRQFVDRLVPGKKYQYRILVVFDNGSRSEFSKELNIQY
jgi:uncharacterized protein